jgi:hypothetical protein
MKRFGLIETINYLFYNGLIKRVKNKIYYILKNNKYPQNIIFITSLPKSGSTWLSNMLSDIDGFDLFAPSKWNTYITDKWDDSRWDLTNDIFTEFNKKLAVIRGHTLATEMNLQVLNDSNIKYIIGVRDPRDKLISEYYYSRNFPGHWAHDLAINKSLSEFISYKLESGEFDKETINWLRNWLLNRNENKSIIVRYEDLLADTIGTFNNILKFLDIRINDDKIDYIVDKHSFKNVSGRDRGESDNKQFVRKGVSGEWKSIFTNEQKELFNNIGEDVIKNLNYEPTIS